MGALKEKEPGVLAGGTPVEGDPGLLCAELLHRAGSMAGLKKIESLFSHKHAIRTS